jgi:hypothetical protein
MLDLLNHFAMEADDPAANNNKPLPSFTREKMDLQLVLLLSRLCNALAKQPDLLVHFFKAPSTTDGADTGCFQVLALLLRHLHQEGPVGQASRDALLQCMALSAKNEQVANFVATKSDFCHVSQLNRVNVIRQRYFVYTCPMLSNDRTE